MSAMDHGRRGTGRRVRLVGAHAAGPDRVVD